MTKKVKTIVLPVGGFGTRFLPATKSIPKEMLPVAEKPLIQYAFEEARDAGIERFIFVTGRNKSAIENHFDHAFELQEVLSRREKTEMLEKTVSWLPEAGQIAFIRQGNPLGLGHAVLCAKRLVGDEPFVVNLSDEMVYNTKGNFLKDMIRLYEKKGGSCGVVGLSDLADDEDVSRYGVIKPKKIDGDVVEIADMVEKPKVSEAPSRTILPGRYIFEPEIFDYLEKTKPGKGNEIQLTDAMRVMMKKMPFYGLKFRGNRYDCGQILGYLEANIGYALDNPKISKGVEKIIRKFSEKIK